MQVKPRFESFKILEQYSIVKDDTGNEICLTLIEVKIKDDEYEISESTYKYWTVIGKKQHQYNNKVIAYEHVAFWKKRDTLFSGIINGINIKEEFNGTHCIFAKEYFKEIKPEECGPRTIFKISK